MSGSLVAIAHDGASPIVMYEPHTSTKGIAEIRLVQTDVVLLMISDNENKKNHSA